MTKEFTSGFKRSFNNLSGLQRLFLSVLVAGVSYVVVPSGQMNAFTHLLSAWDVFSFAMIVLSWITFLSTRSMEIRQLARLQDESRILIFIIVLVSTFASLLAIVILLTSNESNIVNKVVHLMVAITGMALSWILVHTLFTLRYAHIYYGDHPDDPEVHAGGLDFPGNEQPDYLDFAYFSFVLGMTFQVSDVEISSKSLRRLALMHGVLSFGFNTIIVALTINIIAGLK